MFGKVLKVIFYFRFYERVKIGKDSMYYPMIEIRSLKMTNIIKTKNEKSF
jgi:hypothetical protein